MKFCPTCYHSCPNCDAPLTTPADTTDRLATFDKTAATITQVRGKDYPHPKVDFGKAMELKNCVQNCEDPLVRHVLEMLCIKIARLVYNPSHLDSWIDIAGYARCGVMVTEPNKQQKQ